MRKKSQILENSIIAFIHTFKKTKTQQNSFHANKILIVNLLIHPSNQFCIVSQKSSSFLYLYFSRNQGCQLAQKNISFFNTLKYLIIVHVRIINFWVKFHPVWAYSILYVYYFWHLWTKKTYNLLEKHFIKFWDFVTT